VSHLHVRLLERAAETLGGTDELCRYLGVPEVCIRVWLRGLVSPPDDVFLKLVDLLSDARTVAGRPGNGLSSPKPRSRHGR